jgi:DNA-binding NtrC family response regulator
LEAKAVNRKKYNKPASILVVDDELSIRDSLTQWFKEDGYRVEAVPDAEEALSKLKPRRWDIVFLDVKLPGMDGMELQQRIKDIDPHAVVIMITAYATVDTAVKSLKEGAYDYVTKPVDPDYLSHLVTNVMQERELLAKSAGLKERIQELYEIDQMVGDSPTMSRIFELIQAVAATDAPVLIRGESGTGKELIARAIHSNSIRRFFPFIVIHCGVLTRESVKHEFFGHGAGARPKTAYPRKGKFEMASGGSVFLDEVSNLGAQAQADLLRIVETGRFKRIGGKETVKVDFRLTCATNRDLDLAVREGEFREDLYYKLNTLSISIPPLRERRSDIPLFCTYFLKKMAGSLNRPVTGFSPEAMGRLENYPWPGNVRELRNAIERAVVVAQGSTIGVEDLPIPRTPTVVPEDHSLQAVEKAHIQNVLEQMRWNITRSARILGIDRVTLYNKMKKYGLRKKP